MEALKQIANIAGHSGLYRILKPSRAGVIVETLDDKKAKTMMGPTARVSVLNDISIYVDTADIKKLVSWYGILRQYAPEVFETKPEETTEIAESNSEASVAESTAAESPVADANTETNA